MVSFVCTFAYDQSLVLWNYVSNEVSTICSNLSQEQVLAVASVALPAIAAFVSFCYGDYIYSALFLACTSIITYLCYETFDYNALLTENGNLKKEVKDRSQLGEQLESCNQKVSSLTKLLDSLMPSLEQLNKVKEFLGVTDTTAAAINKVTQEATASIKATGERAATTIEATVQKAATAFSTSAAQMQQLITTLQNLAEKLLPPPN